MRLWDFGFWYAACGILVLGCPAGILAQGGQQTAARDAQLVGASHKQVYPQSLGRASRTGLGLHLRLRKPRPQNFLMVIEVMRSRSAVGETG